LKLPLAVLLFSGRCLCELPHLPSEEYLTVC
jgi:hypothetical protein